MGALHIVASLALAGTAGVGAAGTSARSLSSNPALAIGARGTEISGDLQTTLVFLSYRRAGRDADGDPYAREKVFLHGEVPYAAVRSDVFRRRGGESGNIGLGFSLALPFSSGANYANDSAGRYHVVDATTYSVYLAPSVALKPIRDVRVGVAPVLAISRLTVDKRVDLAPSLGELLGCDHSVPGDCPDAETGLLEGEFSVKDATGYAPTFQIGAAWDFLEGRGTAGFAYTGGTLTTLKGRSKFTPSLDFNVHSEADFSMTQYLPPIANVGGRWRFTREISGSFEGQWIGYSASKKTVARIENSQLKSDQADVDSLLGALGINEGQLVEGILDKEQHTYRGWQNAWNAIGGIDYDLEIVRVRMETGFLSRATPDRYVSTANLDFDNFTVGGVVEWRPSSHFSIALAANQFFNGGRKVTNSGYGPTKSSASGLAYPSGNGDYDVSATRVNVVGLARF